MNFPVFPCSGDHILLWNFIFANCLIFASEVECLCLLTFRFLFLWTSYAFCPFFYYVGCVFPTIYVSSQFIVDNNIFFLVIHATNILFNFRLLSMYFIMSFNDQIFLILLWSNLPNLFMIWNFCVLRNHMKPTFSSKRVKYCLSNLRL